MDEETEIDRGNEWEDALASRRSARMIQGPSAMAIGDRMRRQFNRRAGTPNLAS